MNVLIDIGFILLITAPAIWLIRKELKKHELKNDLLRQELEELKAEGVRLKNENLRLERLLLYQSIMENLEPLDTF